MTNQSPTSPLHGCLRALAPWRLICLLLSSLLLTACAASREEIQANNAVTDYLSGNYAQAEQRLTDLSRKTNGDFVLNNVRLGSAALANYDLDEAEAAFLRAYEVMNSVGVNEGGRSLGAAIVDEKIKVWTGEPFERAMANYYLGLIYYMRQDYPNARAAFENALFKLNDYSDDKKQNVDSDFVLGSLMLAKAWQKLGRDDLAQANFDHVIKLKPGLKETADWKRNQGSNLLLIVDFGYGPEKIKNLDGAFVGFSPKPNEAGRIPSPWVTVDGLPTVGPDLGKTPMDLLALAQERRWQSIDTIRAIKSGLGTGMIAVGAYEGVKRKPDYGVAAALIGGGLLLKAMSQADIRQWEMLPRTVFVLPLHLPPGKHNIKVGVNGAGDLTQEWRGLVAPEHGEATYYLRLQRWVNGPFDWPPSPSGLQAGEGQNGGIETAARKARKNSQ